jgi:hypothetical protein
MENVFYSLNMTHWRTVYCICCFFWNIWIKFRSSFSLPSQIAIDTFTKRKITNDTVTIFIYICIIKKRKIILKIRNRTIITAITSISKLAKLQKTFRSRLFVAHLGYGRRMIWEYQRQVFVFIEHSKYNFSKR